MREIELITRLHSVKAISIECVTAGRVSMPADVLIAVIAMITNAHPFGMDAVMAKYLDDSKSAERCCIKLIEQASDGKCPRVDLAPFFAAQAIAAFCHKPLVSQRNSIKALHKRHGAYASRSKQRSKKLNLSLRQAKERGDIHAVERYEAMIKKERLALDQYAEKKANQSDWCPRCAGAGTVALHKCAECDGTGHITISKTRMRTYFRNTNVHITDKLFNDMWAYFESCLSYLHYESGDAMQALAKQLREEKRVEA